MSTFRILVGGWHLLYQIMGFGNPTDGGYRTMADALRAVADLNKSDEFRERNLELAVSAHLWHELLVSGGAPNVGHSSEYNNSRAICIEDWALGFEAGEYAPIGRVIPPGFGIPGADHGAFIHPDPTRRRLAHDMMIHAMSESQWVKDRGVGLGQVIYWTGPDGIRWRRLVEGDDPLLSYSDNPQLEEWELIVNGVGGAIKDACEKYGLTGETVLIEGKAGGDPCWLDVFTDPTLEVMGINAINAIAGAKVAQWQGEFCHTRGGGEKFVNGMATAIHGDVFGGRIHMNSGPIASVNFSNLLMAPGGTLMSLFQQYVDPDLLPGDGVAEWIEDQCESLRLGASWSEENNLPLEIEFDARFSRESDTIGALRKSTLWVADKMREFGATPVLVRAG